MNYIATIGLEVDSHDLLTVFRNWRALMCAAAANYLLVPVAAFALLEMPFLIFEKMPMANSIAQSLPNPYLR